MTNSSNTQPIKILQKTYHLPVLAGDSLKQLQTTIQSCQALIKTGEEVVDQIVEVEVETIVEVWVERQEEVPGGFLGLGRKTITRRVKEKRPQKQKQQRTKKVRQTLDINQRFNVLENQIRDYDR
mgnify:CR=1 FL=1